MTSPSPQSSLSPVDSDIEAPPPRASHSVGSKRAASIAFSDHSPVSPHRRRPPPQPSSATVNHGEDEEDLPSHHNHHHHQHSTALSDISSDTSGSVPGSPRDDDEFGEQVTLCKWDGCNEDLGNMDDLVKHINEEHIGSRRAKYACEWDDCNRKGMPHASGYALRAHMRSHTREKPFYCTLPECDRSFTRSDALAKHMRTVHETEALRPSDPIPKSHPNHPQNIANSTYTDALKRQNKSSNGTPKTPYIKIVTTSGDLQSPANGPNSNGGYSNIIINSPSPGGDTIRLRNLPLQPPPLPPLRIYYPPTDPFDPDEVVHPPKELYRYLKIKLKWAKSEQETLEKDLAGYVKRRREAWIKKELLLDRVLKSELGEDEYRNVSVYCERGKGKKNIPNTTAEDTAVYKSNDGPSDMVIDRDETIDLLTDDESVMNMYISVKQPEMLLREKQQAAKLAAGQAAAAEKGDITDEE